MRRSRERILTTHVGSLPRPPDLSRLLLAREAGKEVDLAEIERLAGAAVADAVSQQLQAGIDFISDGEMGKPGFVRYVKDRLDGFSGQSSTPQFADIADFPEFARWRASEPGRAQINPACEAPITVRDTAAVHRDIERLKAALNGRDPAGCFMPAASPGVIAMNLDNHYYPSHEAYLEAIADAMRYEYRAITDAGFVLQLDCPDLAMGRHRHFKDRPVAEFIANCELSIEALNHAVKGIPAGQLRLHLCWGNYEGPHTHDVDLADVLPTILQANVEALSIEAANPRHEHEWRVFKDIPLPQDTVLMPGVIDSTTNFVEHPRLVADRIERFAELVPKECLIASVDCGFGTSAGRGNCAPDVVWAKLAALAEGARIASRELWP
jgi:5-methyltetrahydropteroyltriglutamate--homocysteine methyltransferase